MLYLSCEKNENKQKEAGIGPFLKQSLKLNLRAKYKFVHDKLFKISILTNKLFLYPHINISFKMDCVLSRNPFSINHFSLTHTGQLFASLLLILRQIPLANLSNNNNDRGKIIIFYDPIFNLKKLKKV